MSCCTPVSIPKIYHFGARPLVEIFFASGGITPNTGNPLGDEPREDLGGEVLGREIGLRGAPPHRPPAPDPRSPLRRPESGEGPRDLPPTCRKCPIASRCTRTVRCNMHGSRQWLVISPAMTPASAATTKREREGEHSVLSNPPRLRRRGPPAGGRRHLRRSHTRLVPPDRAPRLQPLSLPVLSRPTSSRGLILWGSSYSGDFHPSKMVALPRAGQKSMKVLRLVEKLAVTRQISSNKSIQYLLKTYLESPHSSGPGILDCVDC